MQRERHHHTKQASGIVMMSEEAAVVDGFLETLSDDLLMVILSWVPPLDLLRSASWLSRRFAALIFRHEPFWQSLLPANKSLTLRQMQRYCIFADSKEPPLWLGYGSLLVQKEIALTLRERNEGRTCLASTTEYTKECIEHVLPETGFELPLASEEMNSITDLDFTLGGLWWSSRPSATQDTNELLLFTTRYPVALISDVAIKPLLDPFNRETVYTWKNTVIRAYRLGADSFVTRANLPCVIPHTDIEGPVPAGILFRSNAPAKSNADTINDFLGGQTPVYESDLLAGPSDSSWQSFSLSSPVVANVVTVTLVGKNQRQFTTSGFYSCVKQVAVRGIPM